MLTVVVPTWNEALNIGPLVASIKRCLQDTGYSAFEILVMDDGSPDETGASALESGAPEVRVVDRSDRPRGLAAAVLDGFKEARGDIIVVCDADFSHPPQTVPLLVRAVEDGALMAIGSRYIDGGGSDGWPVFRRFMSRTACLLARPFTSVRDATSGFFAVRRSVVEDARLDARGFKIGLEVLLKGDHLGLVREVPFVFHNRSHGLSKLRARHLFAYALQLMVCVASPQIWLQKPQSPPAPRLATSYDEDIA